MVDEIPVSLFTRAQLRATGVTDRQLDTRLASGALIRARQGILFAVPGAAGPPVRRRDGNLAGPGSADRGARPASAARTPGLPVAVKAALLTSPGRELVVSHATAAQLFALPEPLSGWPQPHFTATTGPTRCRSGIKVNVAPLPEEQVHIHLGIAVTSPDRTVAECLRVLPSRDGLAVLDAALRRGLTSVELVVGVLRGQAGWPGVARARQVVALGDGRRESPLESWSAWAFFVGGVPSPEWQVEVREPGGRLIGRADCWWTGGVVGEADGRSKYALAAAERGGGSGAAFDVLHDERRREQRLREVGADVVRWSTGDVLKEASVRALAQRITGAIAMAHDHARFTGVVAPAVLQKSTSPPP